jgi:hypothetical protein
LNSYLIEFHPSFLLVADRIKIKKDDFDKESEKEYRRIMKVLNSQKFKRFFYQVVDYKLNEKPLPEPKNNLWSRIKKFVAKQYLRLFNKELYESLLRFKLLTEGYQKLNAAADDYIANTSLDERADRAVDVGISSKENRDAHKRMRNISNMRIAAIHEKNNVE